MIKLTTEQKREKLMLKKLSIFALIMSVCGIATAGMPVMKTDFNLKEPKVAGANQSTVINKDECEKCTKDIRQEIETIKRKISKIDFSKINSLEKQINDLSVTVNNLKERVDKLDGGGK
jgi:peptidoglycan hydrolase CwlO-like protein